MRALYIENGHLQLRKVAKPQRQSRESLIKVHVAGICTTDLQLQAGYKNFSGIPGHEFVGYVLESDQRHLVGKRVVGEINIGCGHCVLCRNEDQRHCRSRKALGILGHHGAHGEFVVLPTQNLHLVPDDISNDEAVFVEPLAAACQILEQVHILPDYRVAIIGDGKLGLLVAQVLALTGCELHVIGHHAHKLKLLNNLAVDTHLRVPDMKAQVVVDCTGNAHGFAIACQIVEPQGTLVLKSTYQGTTTIACSDLVVNEITVIGSRCGKFAPAIRLLAKRKVEVRKFIGKRFDLSQGIMAYRSAADSNQLKVLINCDNEPN